MSGNIYQTYGVQRISKYAKESESTRNLFDLRLSVRVSERLGRKIRMVSDKTRLPEQIISGEAIARGFALLKS